MFGDWHISYMFNNKKMKEKNTGFVNVGIIRTHTHLRLLEIVKLMLVRGMKPFEMNRRAVG